MPDVAAKILLVDDDARSLLAMESLLAGSGRIVIKADSGQEALRQVLRHDFAVILLDVRMPRVDGFETAELIRQREQSRFIPIIFLSAVDKLDEDVFRGLASGAVDYLFKPVVPEVLQSKVAVFVELYRMRERVKREALRHGEARFRLLVNSIKDYSIILLSPEGLVTSWNPGARLIEGYEATEIIGRHFSCFYTEDDIQRGYPGLELQITASVGQHEDEGWRVRKDGTTFWANVLMSALKDEGGKITGFARVTRDLTERKAAEEQLREVAAQLEQRVGERTQELVRSQQRLRELATELTLTEQRERKRLAGELHDYLAQLLVLMRMKIRQAAPRVPDDKATSLLKEADQAITDSLNYTRSLVAELAPPALQEFGLVEGFGWLADQMKTHGLTVSIERHLQRIMLPDDQAVLVFQSVRELLFNVLKHAGTGEAEVALKADEEGELTITVSDKGFGFDPADVSDRSEERKRFGLFSVRERMEAMGGRLVIASQPQQGTRAQLIFPYWPATVKTTGVEEVELGILNEELSKAGGINPKQSKETNLSGPRALPQLNIQNPASPPAARQLRIVLADDHAMVRQGLRGILEAYQDVTVVGEAADGEEAVELARLLIPDVIVMDVNMAKMDGIEATRRIKAQWPSVLIVGLSFSNPSQVEPLLLQAGASCYVSKDSAGDRLYEAITAVVKAEAEKQIEKTAIVLPGREPS
ncbi:MAG TPA: response regulator [Nitrospiraceae bacterium]|nr:response regulator [Nitrospiraceae bacterium]